MSFYNASQERKVKVMPSLINKTDKVVATDEKIGLLNKILPQSSLATCLITQADGEGVPPIRERRPQIPGHLFLEHEYEICITCVEFSKLWKNTETHHNIFYVNFL